MILSDSVSFNAMLQSYKISNEVPEPPNWGWNLSTLHVWKLCLMLTDKHC
jgi:hypothetical protein